MSPFTPFASYSSPELTLSRPLRIMPGLEIAYWEAYGRSKPIGRTGYTLGMTPEECNADLAGFSFSILSDLFATDLLYQSTIHLV